VDSYTTLGAWIKGQRKELGLTQATLAKNVGCAISTIRKIESGILRPSHEMTIRIARCLALDPALIPRFITLARPPADVDAPALPVESAGRPSLPVAPSALIGREQDMAFIIDCLRAGHTRLITLVGPPGVGKTRLAIAIATAMAERAVTAVVFVPLEAVPAARLVLPAIAEALHVSERPGQPLAATIQAALASQPLLMVLDNLEHVLEAAADIAELLGRCPALTILATSQEILHLSNEQQVPVLPLLTPPRTGKEAWQTLEAYPAVALFGAQARRLVPAFALTQDNAATVAAICARLDGIPLAIQLIAARIKHTALAELLDQLDTLTSVILDHHQGRPKRQPTVRSAIAWSYQLLSVAEQQLFRILGVFAGGCALEDLEVIASRHSGTAMDVTEHLSTLLDKSMIQDSHTAGGESRFSMLSLLREYALEQLALSGERDPVYAHYARCYADLAEQANTKFRGPEERLWVQRLARDHDNIRAVLAWSIDAGRPALALQMGAALWRFWEMQNHVSEGRRWLAQALAFAQEVEPQLRAKAYHAAGTLATFQADNDQAIACYEHSLALRQELQDTAGMAATMLNLATVHYHRSAYAQSEALLTQVLDHYLAIQNLRGVASVLTNMGMVGQDQGQIEFAEGCYAEALAIQAELGNQRSRANLLGLLGTLAQEQGDHRKARPLFTASLELHRSLGLSPAMVTPLDGLGYVALAEGDLVSARASWLECLATTVTMEQPRFIVQALESCATLAGATGRPDLAARLWGAAAALRQAIEAPLAPAIAALHHAAQLRAQLGCDAQIWRQAWEQGRAMSLDQAVDRAHQL
jgi:predicted ATPase/transcriptional regulator with XRE-family HTH domain